MNRHNHPLRAFTLIELLVVISIIALLIGLLLPALSGARLAAKKAREASGTRQLAVALTAYATDRKQILPIGQVQDTGYDMTRVDRDDWEEMVEDYSLPASEDPTEFGCSAWSVSNPGGNWFYHPTDVEIRVPWTYWGNRPDATGVAGYDFLQSLDEAGVATSDTLLTCHGRQGTAFTSLSPHLPGRNGEGSRLPAGAAGWIAPEAICTGFVDGSVIWQPFEVMESFQFGGTTSIFYYSPR